MLMESIHDGVTRYDLARSIAGRGRYWTAASLVDGLLIDSGCAHSAPDLIQALVGEPLARIVNTHSHEDHIGANGLLQWGRPGLEILAHAAALAILADPRRTQPLQPYRRVFWGWPEPSVARPVVDGTIIETEHYRFRVIYTPGHSPDHLCLYEAERGWLFSGDLFVGGQDRALRAGYDIWEIIASLKRIARFPAAWLFPGGARVRPRSAAEPLVPSSGIRRAAPGGAAAALTAKIPYLEEVGEGILEL